MNSMKYFSLLIICMLGFVSFGRAKSDPTITGRIINQKQEAIPGASVYLLTANAKGLIKAAITNDAGVFTLSGYPKGRFIVEVSAIGYTKAVSDAFDAGDSALQIPTLTLNAIHTEIAAVTVTGDLPQIQSKNGKLVMNVENSSLAAGNNALDILKRAPGVDVDKDNNISLMGQQGVNVTIDGRQTYMTAEQLATLLKSTDGSQIKSIEVSTTRSAKEDAEGAGGVINISMKKNRMEGFNGNFLASAAAGKHFRGNSSVNLNYRKNNTTVFGNYSYMDNELAMDIGVKRILPDGASQMAFDQFTLLKERDKTHNYKFGIEQKTSDRNTLVWQFTGNNNLEKQDSRSETLMGAQLGGIVDSTLFSTSYGKKFFDRYSFNLNNEFKIDTLGRKITADVDYSSFKTNNGVNYGYMTEFLNPVRPNPEDQRRLEQERSFSDATIKIFVAKVDYTQPLGKGTLEAGAKYSRVASDNSIKFEYLKLEEWNNFTNRTNNFDYVEQITAGYIDYAQQLKKWGYKIGLRLEQTNSDGVSVTINKQVNRDYLDYFPSASLSYNLNPNHVFSLSYARKVMRPNYRFLNPFEEYLDKRTFMKGNPNLKPQYTDGFMLNYTLYKMFNVALGFDHASGAIVESIGQDTIAKTTWVIRENLATQNTAYLNLTIPARIGKRWTIFNNLTGIYMNFKGPIAGDVVNQGSLFFQGNSTHNFKFSKQFTSEVAIRYYSPFIYNVYRIEGRFNTDIGLSYNVKDQRSSFKLAVTDVFHSNHNNLKTNYGKFNSSIAQYNDNQTIRLTFTYKFGNLKQVISKRDSGSDEKDRAL